MLFNRSLATCFFPDRWKLSFVTPICKSGRRNDLSNYRGIPLLSAIAKLFEMLVYRVMSEDLRSVNMAFFKSRSSVSNLLEYSFFVLKSIEDDWQVDSIYTDFSKVFDRCWYLNVGKCKSITFLRLSHPVEFSYMLEGIILDRVNSITDLEVVMESKMSFSRYLDVIQSGKL
jgi:hypothetical protein